MDLKAEHHLVKGPPAAPFPENTNRSTRPSEGTPSQSIITDTGEIEVDGRSYVTPARLAEILGITVRTLARWHKCQLGPPRITVGRLALYEMSKLAKWLDTLDDNLTQTPNRRK
jgi:hypothetical protein